MEGIVNPARIKVAVCENHDLLMSADNKNDTMEWFKTNADKLEENLRSMGLKWAYAIETCPDGEPFIYMLISPNMSTYLAQQMTDRAKRTLPEDREMIVCEGPFRAFNINQYDNTPETLAEALLTHYADIVLRVTEV